MSFVIIIRSSYFFFSMYVRLLIDPTPHTSGCSRGPVTPVGNFLALQWRKHGDYILMHIVFFEMRYTFVFCDKALTSGQT